MTNPQQINLSGRKRPVYLTDDLKDKILHIERLSPKVRRSVLYDARTVHDAKIERISEELADIAWFYETGVQFRYVRSFYFDTPIEAIMKKGPPHTWMDLEHIYETADQMRKLSLELKSLAEEAEQVAKKIETLGIVYLKGGI
jgi:hypothetical protein